MGTVDVARTMPVPHRDRGESPGLSDILLEGDAEQRAQRANADLAEAFDKGQGLEEALQCAAEADARKAEDNLKAERRRCGALHISCNCRSHRTLRRLYVPGMTL